MEKSDKILAAIEQLARTLTGQINAVRADLTGQIEAVRADVAVLQTDVAELKAGQAVLRTDVAELKAGQAVLQTDVAELKAGQSAILQHLDVAELKGRVDEQGRTIAALIPAKIAAVGR